MEDQSLRLIVIGASAGGHSAVSNALKGLPADINAAFVVVIHNVVDIPSYFPTQFQKSSPLTVSVVSREMEISRGHLYFSIPNHHLIVTSGKLILSNGPRENLFRPSIDVLFRSAAVSYSNQCVGILLSGRLNDGVAGLNAIKVCGGLTLIQDPGTAEFNEMPLTAKESVLIDYEVPVDQLSTVLTKICNSPLPEQKPIPPYLVREAAISQKIKSQIKTEESLGEQVPLSCSSCGGPLWKMENDSVDRYRCHVGHSFTQEALLHGQDEKLEETLWASLRTFEEKKLLLKRMANKYASEGSGFMSRSYENKIEEVSDHIYRLRNLMKLHD